MVISSYSVRGTLTAYDITALRFGAAGLVMLPILIRKGLRVGPWGRWGGLWLAALMGAPYNTVAILGMKYAPTSHAAGIINTTMLVLTTLAGILLLKERTSRLRLLGIAISIAGIGFLLSATAGGADMDLGHLLFLIGGAMWAGYAVSLKRWGADPLHVAALVCSLSGMIYLPIYLMFLPSQLSWDHWHEAAFQAVYQGIINSVFALICFNQGIKLLGASTASAFLPLIPVLATLLAIPVMGEVPTGGEWLGVGLAAAGVMLATGIVERWLAAKKA